MMNQIDLFIGFDAREAVAYHVCANSAIRLSSIPVVIHPIALNNCSSFYKEQHSTKTGLTETDPTNQFIFSRFLVPHLMGYGSKGQFAIFVDGDMIFRDDPAKLLELADPYKAIQVVKHNYKTKSDIKYLDQVNLDYPMKNWSSVMLWNTKHFNNSREFLSPAIVQTKPGRYLHRFEWIKDEALIGDLPKEWNWLPDEYGYNKEAKLLHWTLGTPCFLDPQYSMAPMSEEWHRERMLTDYSMQSYQV